MEVQISMKMIGAATLLAASGAAAGPETHCSSALLSIAAFVVSLVVLVMTRRRDADSVRPVLVFGYAAKAGWHVENVGNGPALDVMLLGLSVPGYATRIDVRLPSLSRGQKLLLPLRAPEDEKLDATYCDFAKRRYRSNCEKDLSTVRRGDQLTRDERDRRRDQAKRLWDVEQAQAEQAEARSDQDSERETNEVAARSSASR